MIEITIILMAIVTYLTRILGFLVVAKMNLSRRALAVLEVAPACVLISVIAPRFVSNQPSDLIALAFAAVLASRCSLLTTVFGSVIFTALLRMVLNGA